MSVSGARLSRQRKSGLFAKSGAVSDTVTKLRRQREHQASKQASACSGSRGVREGGPRSRLAIPIGRAAGRVAAAAAACGANTASHASLMTGRKPPPRVPAKNSSSARRAARTRVRSMPGERASKGHRRAHHIALPTRTARKTRKAAAAAPCGKIAPGGQHPRRMRHPGLAERAAILAGGGAGVQNGHGPGKAACPCRAAAADACVSTAGPSPIRGPLVRRHPGPASSPGSPPQPGLAVASYPGLPLRTRLESLETGKLSRRRLAALCFARSRQPWPSLRRSRSGRGVPAWMGKCADESSRYWVFGSLSAESEQASTHPFRLTTPVNESLLSTNRAFVFAFPRLPPERGSGGVATQRACLPGKSGAIVDTIGDVSHSLACSI